MSKLYKAILITVLLFSTSWAAQFTISGVVTDATTGDKLLGANVYLLGTSWGAATDANGEYSITVDEGSYTITCSYIGFTKIEKEINVNADMTLNFAMTEYQFTLSVEVISDRAKDRETPVAFTNITKKDIQFNLGSQDIPLVLNTTPSVYSTMQGGGAGDSRINLR
ncbi:MAG: carboxypeptidase-like regulatory domain-containing protein, partial [Ignavibacteriaceae bacterium]